LNYQSKIVLLAIGLFSFFTELTAQDQTVGVFLNDETAVNGYTLFSPISSKSTYLIDNCGNKINEWTFNTVPGMIAYLLEDGRLLRAGRLFGGFGAGGSGGLIEIKSWDDELLWSYAYSDDIVKQHHDVEYLDNGNILLIAWEKRPITDVTSAGRIPETIGSDGVWFEQVVELKPIGTDQAEIVWEWHLYDHLVQEYDTARNNYGRVQDHPNLLNINYLAYNEFGNGLPGSSDWVHLNAIDYNRELDLILISSRNTSEVYVIDHSCTKQEAATHSGGNFGKGGDFLFRWGNKQAYDAGTDFDKNLFSQHDASWVRKNGEYTGEISIFNNGLGRDTDNTSSAEVIKPLIENGEFSYDLNELEFLIEYQTSIFPEEAYEFSSPRVSSVQVLDNDNYFICSGNNGIIYEISAEGELLWKYVNPIGQIGSTPQGQEALINDMFRALKYTTDYAAFDDRDLSPMGVLENNPVDYGCEIYDDTNSIEGNEILINFEIFPNPVSDILYIKSAINTEGRYRIYDLMGSLVMTNNFLNLDHIELSFLRNGLYYLTIEMGALKQDFKFVKQ